MNTKMNISRRRLDHTTKIAGKDWKFDSIAGVQLGIYLVKYLEKCHSLWCLVEFVPFPNWRRRSGHVFWGGGRAIVGNVSVGKGSAL